MHFIHNFKRRNAKERVELMQTAGKEIVTSLLDVLDDCDRAEKQLQTSNDLEQIKEGIQLVFGKLRNTLQSKFKQRIIVPCNCSIDLILSLGHKFKQ